MVKKLTKQERKDLALKEYEKITDPARKEYEKIIDLAWKEYENKCKEIDAEPEEIPEEITQNGIKYRRVK